MLLLDLLWFLLVLFVLHLFFKLLPLYIFISLHVLVKDHPLGCLERKVRHDWWICLHTLFSEWKIESLRRSLLEVKLISERLLDGELVTLSWTLSFKFILENFIDVFKKLLIPSLFVVPESFLVHGLIRVFKHDITFELDVHFKHVYLVINLKMSVLK